MRPRLARPAPPGLARTSLKGRAEAGVARGVEFVLPRFDPKTGWGGEVYAMMVPS